MKYKKRAALIVLSLLLLLPFSAAAYPASDSYSIDSWGSVVPEPAPYVPSRRISGGDMGAGVGPLKEPADMCVGGDKVYIADAGNNRIVVADRGLRAQRVLDEFTLDGKTQTFNNPQGVFVSAAGKLYVADTDNARVLEFDEEGRCVRAFGRPSTPLLQSSFAYKPTKVAVDAAGRLYITATGINLGIIQLDKEGQFQTFMGAIQVTVNYVDYIWKRYFSTAEQIDRMTLDVPTEYSNLYLDDSEFLYGTVSTLSVDDVKGGAPVIRRLNPTGVDVLRRSGHIPVIGNPDGESRFADVTATSFGTYFALDQTYGAVYTYDVDGNLLFAFGSLGNRFGNLQKPAAICQFDDGQQLLVLDTGLDGVMVYDATEYGGSMLTALKQAASGDMEDSYQAWKSVLKANANNEYAYLGIGRYYLKQEDYKTAMKYFEMVNNRTYYDKAFNLERKELMQRFFGPAITIALSAAAAAAVFLAWRRLRRKVVAFKWR